MYNTMTMRGFLFFLNFALLSSAVIFSSCDAILFNRPQPVDSKNIYEFPKKFRGSWVVDRDTITITKDYYRSTMKEDTTKIINGIYINPADTVIFEKSDTAAFRKRMAINKPYFSLRSITFDSLKKPIDTVSNFIIRGDLIYKNETRGISKGTRFFIKYDTLYKMPERSAIELDLGRNVFLRQVSEDRYLVNINATLFPDVEVNPGWWMIYLLEMKSDKIFIRGIDDDKMNYSEKIYKGHDKVYFDSHWTKQDVQRLIQEGLFEEADQPLDKTNRIDK